MPPIMCTRAYQPIRTRGDNVYGAVTSLPGYTLFWESFL